MREAKRTQISFADLELGHNLRLDPLLEQISDFLDQHGEIVTAVLIDNYISPSHCLAGFVTARGLLPHEVCYRTAAKPREALWEKESVGRPVQS